MGLLIVTTQSSILHASSITLYDSVLSCNHGLTRSNVVSQSKTSNHGSGKYHDDFYY